ncbi:hypothetical protein BGX34_001326 [Mortierella sp. NVP85]|nr:hypothetical protein BGX34_001326 [Mortierella sp. NVP85]
MPVHLSHKQLILKEILLRKSTFQVLALLDLIDMKELLNCKIQNRHPIQNGCDLSEEATTKDETYGSRFAHQLLNMGKPREAILLIARVLKERNKELDHRAIPYLIELMDPGLMSEFVGDYYGVCATVLEAIESQLCIQLGDLHQGRDPRAQIHLAKIAFSLIMGFDLEVELDTRFPTIKFVVKYNDIMALLDRSLASSDGQDPKRLPNPNSVFWETYPRVFAFTTPAIPLTTNTNSRVCFIWSTTYDNSKPNIKSCINSYYGTNCIFDKQSECTSPFRHTSAKDPLSSIHSAINHKSDFGQPSKPIGSSRTSTSPLERRQYLSRSQAQCIPRYLLHSPYHRTQSSERQYQTAGQRIPHRKTPSMTTLLQLACDADDCVYVVDTTMFLKDRTNQLPRVIGRFFSDERIRKIVFKWSRERSILEYTFPFLKQPENQLMNILDLSRVWCRFVPPPHLIDQGHCHGQGYASKNTAIAISTNAVTGNMHPESYASLAGGIVPWARYTVEFWSMRPQSVPMTCLQFAGPNVALKKLCGKQLAPGFRCIDWTSRPLTAEQLDYAAAAAYSLRSIYEVLSNRPFIS